LPAPPGLPVTCHHNAEMKPSSDEDRLQDYFWKLEKLIPNPYMDWGKCVRPCKWQRIIKERQKKDPDAAG
jgi:hypothetical protein